MLLVELRSFAVVCLGVQSVQLPAAIEAEAPGAQPTRQATLRGIYRDYSPATPQKHWAVRQRFYVCNARLETPDIDLCRERQGQDDPRGHPAVTGKRRGIAHHHAADLERLTRPK